MKVTPSHIVLQARQYQPAESVRYLPHWFSSDSVVSHFINCMVYYVEHFEHYVTHAMQRALPQLPEGWLREQTAHFLLQEQNHITANNTFLDQFIAAGYVHFRRLDQRVSSRYGYLLEDTADLGALLQLAVMLEHMAAVIAQEFLLLSEHQSASFDPATFALFRYHAVEEVEHKGLTFDVFTALFDRHPLADSAVQADWQQLLQQTRHDMHRGVAYCLQIDRLQGGPPVCDYDDIPQRISAHFSLFDDDGAIARLALPNFHPWDQDDLALLQRWDPGPSNVTKASIA